jgi:hypothetical protein
VVVVCAETGVMDLPYLVVWDEWHGQHVTYEYFATPHEAYQKYKDVKGNGLDPSMYVEMSPPTDE